MATTTSVMAIKQTLVAIWGQGATQIMDTPPSRSPWPTRRDRNRRACG